MKLIFMKRISISNWKILILIFNYTFFLEMSIRGFRFICKSKKRKVKVHDKKILEEVHDRRYRKRFMIGDIGRALR